MKFIKLERALKALGYIWVRGNGGHQVYRHPIAVRPIVVPMDNREIGALIVRRTLKNAVQYIDEGIAKQAINQSK